MRFRDANDRAVSDAADGHTLAFRHTSPSMLASSDGLVGYMCDFQSMLGPLKRCASEGQGPTAWDGSLDIRILGSLYANAIMTREEVVNEDRRVKLPTTDPVVWVHVFPQVDGVQRALQLSKAYRDPALRHPLCGIPISTKVIIDIAEVPTTVARPEFTYIPEKDAPLYWMYCDWESKSGPIGHWPGRNAISLRLNEFRVLQRVYFLHPYTLVYPSHPNKFPFNRHSHSGVREGSAVFIDIIGFTSTRSTIHIARVVPASKSLDTIAIEALTIADARIV
ncbi:hypothetical protein BS47DRAFT_585318 [Hydnum rufescens UP504]|uniref:Uncharacterized protein n=1 Tax=Hydnum rufescens UP504 TaxID=1448309 RepID=A0A9P6B3B8_9AGAM|nr:hypothetical protein BS47DRAFT_585318 [Hydnum rufescens UP504]